MLLQLPHWIDSNVAQAFFIIFYAFVLSLCRNESHWIAGSLNLSSWYWCLNHKPSFLDFSINASVSWFEIVSHLCVGTHMSRAQRDNILCTPTWHLTRATLTSRQSSIYYIGAGLPDVVSVRRMVRVQRNVRSWNSVSHEEVHQWLTWRCRLRRKHDWTRALLLEGIFAKNCVVGKVRIFVQKLKSITWK